MESEQKKRSVGVTVIGWISLIIGFIFVLGALLIILDWFSLPKGSKLVGWNKLAITMSIGHLLLGGIYVITGWGILKLEQVARLFNIVISLCVTIFDIWFIYSWYSTTDLASRAWAVISIIYCGPSLIPALIFIIYLTRPKVKEQFR